MSQGGRAEGEMSGKAPLLSLVSGNSSFRASGGGLGAFRRPGSCWLGSGSPQGQVPSLEWLLCIQNISLQKALLGRWGGSRELPHYRQDPLCPESGSQSPRPSQPPAGAGSLHSCSLPLPSLSPVVSRQSVEGQVRPCGRHPSSGLMHLVTSRPKVPGG